MWILNELKEITHRQLKKHDNISKESDTTENAQTRI